MQDLATLLFNERTTGTEQVVFSHCIVRTLISLMVMVGSYTILSLRFDVLRYSDLP